MWRTPEIERTEVGEGVLQGFLGNLASEKCSVWHLQGKDAVCC